MKIKKLYYSFLLLFLFFLSAIHSADGKTLTPMSSWGGSCASVFPYEQNGHTFIAAGIGSRLEIIDLNDTATLIQRGAVDCGDYVKDIVVENNIAYVAALKAGLKIVDVTNPDHPEIIGSHLFPGIAVRLVLRGKTVYLADSLRGPIKIDVSNPSSPSSSQLELLTHPTYSVLLTSDKLFFGGKGSTTLYSLKGTDSLIYNCKMSCSVNNLSIAQRDCYIYIAHPNGIQIVDFEAPVDYCICNCHCVTNATDCIIDGDRLYVAAQDSGIKIYDISVAKSISPVSGYKEKWDSGMRSDVDGAQHLVKKDNLLYVAYGKLGLKIIDISNEKAPVKRAELKAYNFFTAIAVNDTLLLTTDLQGQLHILSIKQPLAPKLIASAPVLQFCRDISVVDGFAYIASRETGMQIYDIHNPKQPVNLCWAVCDTALSLHAVVDEGEAVCVYGNVAYLANDHGIETFDISNKSSPLKTSDVGQYRGISASVKDSFLYAAQMGSDDGLYIYDLHTSVLKPVLSGYFRIMAYTTALIMDSIAYVLDNNSRLCVVDIKDKTKPSSIGERIPIPTEYRNEHGYPFSALLEYPNILVSYGNSGIQIFNVSKPKAPVFSENIYVPGEAFMSVVKDSLLYCASYDGGIQILKINNKTVNTLSKPAVIQNPEYSKFKNSLYSLDGKRIGKKKIASGCIISPSPDTRKNVNSIKKIRLNKN